MAMRLFTKEEFESHLREQLSLEPTDHQTATTHAWITSTGRHVMVPVMPTDERYPDFLLNDVYEQVKKIESEN